MKQKVLIINTGGTISSVRSADGYVPARGFVKAKLKKIIGLSDRKFPDYDLLELDPLLDSSNITVKDWNYLAQLISENYVQYTGFVIFHGTDTMAYTASILSFMLENLTKPVILTGSQIPLSELRNDAIENIISSLLFASNPELQEVCIYFNQRLLRGNRSKKVSAVQLNAFDSPNYPDLAEVDLQLKLKSDLLLNVKSTETFKSIVIQPHFIANFRLFPGFVTQILQGILKQPLRGLVLETFGIGNARTNDKQFLNMLEYACSQGIIIINCSQCYQAKVDMHNYATGKQLLKVGLVSGYNMTPEAAHCKLLYLLSKGYETDEIKRLMQVSLRGELEQ